MNTSTDRATDKQIAYVISLIDRKLGGAGYAALDTFANALDNSTNDRTPLYKATLADVRDGAANLSKRVASQLIDLLNGLGGLERVATMIEAHAELGTLLSEATRQAWQALRDSEARAEAARAANPNYQMVTVEEAAEILDLSEEKVRELKGLLAYDPKRIDAAKGGDGVWRAMLGAIHQYVDSWWVDEE